MISTKQIMKTIKKIVIISSLVLVTACSVHKGEFDCPGNKGMGCKGMIDVYDTLHQKTPLFPISNVAPSLNNNLETDKKSAVDASKVEIGKNSAINSQALAKPIYRSSDKIIKIWFNSYFDRLNNYRDSQYVYSVISPASWVIR